VPSVSPDFFSVNKYKRYPVGTVKVVTKNFSNIRDYFGLAKVTILPPPRLYLPVLPYRSHGKLTFPLCRTCVDMQLPENCTHSTKERELTGTWCTIEIIKALQLGYKIRKIFEVWHYPESTEKLFAGYIDTFLKLKTEASGFPEKVKTEDQINEYLENFLEKEGVQLNRENIQPNQGMRTFAKLCLNSFWGRLGMQDSRHSTIFIKESKQLYEYLLSGKHIVGFYGIGLNLLCIIFL
jgi:DNA polymerase type B, organellar and viral